ncbi:MAG: hypothetical protein GXP53_04580 [Deltaproteobacteria bacterium]|nr:hypothetical protein [Deltaproteobacteria bacterium]
MTDFVFSILESIGFRHPIHPAITHLPMGMVMGGFLFGLAAFLFRRPELSKTAWHCSILALIGVFPTALAGYLDWQHTYNGEWLNLIKIKMVLAFILLVLLSVSVKINAKTDKVSFSALIIYALCLLTGIGLGFTGGELMYG